MFVYTYSDAPISHHVCKNLISQCPHHVILFKILVHSQLIGMTTILLAGYIEATIITPSQIEFDHLQPLWRQQRQL